MKHLAVLSMRNVGEIEDGRFRAKLRVILDNEQMSGHLMGITGLTMNKWLFMTTVLMGNQDHVDKVIKPAVETVAKISTMQIVDERPTVKVEDDRYEILVTYTIEWDDYSEEKEEFA